MAKISVHGNIIPIVVCCSFLSLIPVPTKSQQVETLPIHTRRISERVIVAWPGDHAQTTNMIAIASERGIVVVDTESSWSVTAEIRDVFARELQRNDFVYLINTHGHTDHGGGNQVFQDAVIVAHERSPGMQVNALGSGNLERRRERLDYWLTGMSQQLESLPAEGPEALAIEERSRWVRRILTDLGPNFELTLPKVTFPDRLNIDLGDLTVRIYYFGGLHTNDHVVVHVPEEGLLMTGDILAESWIPVLSEGDDVNIPFMLANWDTILQEEDQIRHIVHGHWDLGISLLYFQQAHRYVRTLWEEVIEAHSLGTDLETVCEQLDLENRFPEFRELVHEYEGVDYHRRNIELMWALRGDESPVGYR